MSAALEHSTPIRWHRDDDRIVHLILDTPDASANTMDSVFLDTFEDVPTRLEAAIQAEPDAIAGVLIRSAKRSFLAGADLRELAGATTEDAERWRATSRRLKSALRRLETLGVPVAAVLDGPAMGGGFELALACHHRTAVEDSRVQVGLPEVTLGLLPGAGGLVRTVRLLGLDVALDQLLLTGQRLSARRALVLGLIDELAHNVDDAVAEAKEWISTRPDPRQPWDVKGYVAPGRKPQSSAELSAALQSRLNGANYPAPRAILCAAVESLQVDFATAEKIEEQYFVELVTDPVSTNMIQAFFFDRQAATNRPQPQDRSRRTFSKVAVVGAGMMGGGIAYACACAGLEVVLIDTSPERAEHGKSYTVKALERGRIDVDKQQNVLDRITPTVDFADASGADVVVEAVFEDPGVKAQALANIVAHVASDALLCSNTSTLPISDLAANVERPADFLGMHYFSPVDRMELVELIRGKQTADETLWQALDFVRQIGKVPIVVNDSRGFFTSRTFTAFTNEALAMLGEGVPAPTVEQAALQAGFPAPILQMMDEVTLTLPRTIREAARHAALSAGQQWRDHPADRVIDTMIDDHGRKGRSTGGGFYEFADDRRMGLWPGLAKVFGGKEVISLRDACERLLFAGSLTGIRALEEGVITTVADANVGSILGIGYPGWTGGVLQYVNTYPGGPAGFLARCDELSAAYGDRFDAPQLLADTVAQATTFHDA